jgi:excisionase family DNA binding protein
VSEKTFTTNQAAQELGVTPVRVRAMIRAGRLIAEKFGRDYIIKESNLELVRGRKTGRPSKPKENKGK